MIKKIFLLIYFISISAFSQEVETQKKSQISNDSLNQNEKSVSFISLESIPIAPGCENISKSEQMNCFNQFLNQHIVKNFRFPEEALKKNIQGRVNVQIIIDKEGNVTNIKTGGIASPILKNEAKRIASLLPKFTPAYQNGKPVAVKYTFPLNFIMR